MIFLKYLILFTGQLAYQADSVNSTDATSKWNIWCSDTRGKDSNQNLVDNSCQEI